MWWPSEHAAEERCEQCDEPATSSPCDACLSEDDHRASIELAIVEERQSRRGRRLTDAQLAELYRLYEQGCGVNETARRIGCSPSTVGYHCGRLGTGRPRVRAADLEEIISLNARGLSLQQMATATGFCVSTIRRHLHRHGQRPLRRRTATSPVSASERDRMRYLEQVEGLSRGTIAERMGRSPTTVTKALGAR